ncbi:ATP-binding protein [Priestia flexa]|uniref:ATP-binding protein n=1 Tax=Priestia flexa TaxID=86664 RepID=UPI002165E08D|nr:ATP-binding protein [Priestia flexa]
MTEARIQVKKEGLGLGMNIAKAICELHGGHIVVRSAPGVGTAITMKLPILK